MTYFKTRRKSRLTPMRQSCRGLDFSPSAGCLASSWLATKMTIDDCCSCHREGNGLWRLNGLKPPKSRDIAPRDQSSACAVRLEINEKIHFASQSWSASSRAQSMRIKTPCLANACPGQARVVVQAKFSCPNPSNHANFIP